MSPLPEYLGVANEFRQSARSCVRAGVGRIRQLVTAQLGTIRQVLSVDVRKANGICWAGAANVAARVSERIRLVAGEGF
jgi:hypothetical protein